MTSSPTRTVPLAEPVMHYLGEGLVPPCDPPPDGTGGVIMVPAPPDVTCPACRQAVAEHVIRAALAEAGYPDADVYRDDVDGPIYVEGPPPAVIDRACDLANLATGGPR